MISIQKRFIRLLGTSLKRFKEVQPGLFNFRCPYCGDSQKNSKTARGYFIAPTKPTDSYGYYCHNCGTSKSFQAFTKDQNPNLHSQYLAECFRHKDGHSRAKDREKRLRDTNLRKRLDPSVDPENFHTLNILTEKGAVSIENLNEDHFAKLYLAKRLVPQSEFDKIFFVEEFKKFIHSIQSDKFEKISNDSPAVIFPLLTREMRLIGFQCRNLDPDDKFRYMTIKLETNHEKLYGLHRLSQNSNPEYVTEGAIDSLMLPNAIAVCGSDLMGHSSETAIHILDNEPRNKEIVKKAHQIASSNRPICLLPEKYYGADLNEIRLEYGLSSDSLERLIKKYTFRGLKAIIKFKEWSMV